MTDTRQLDPWGHPASAREAGLGQASLDAVLGSAEETFSDHGRGSIRVGTNDFRCSVNVVTPFDHLPLAEYVSRVGGFLIGERPGTSSS